jgi:branched-chain amino acid aminotransferase
VRLRRADRGVRLRDRGRDHPGGPVKGESAEWVIGDGKPGPVTMRLRDELIGIQYGRKPDPFGWIHKVC